MKLPSIQSQALKVILLSLSMLSFLLCATLIYLHTSYTNKLLLQHGHAQIKHWAQIVEKVGSDQSQQLKALFDTAREEPDVRGLAIFTADNTKLLHLGPPFESPVTAHTNPATNNTLYSLIKNSQTLLFQATLADNSKVYLELSKLPYLLLNLKILLSGFILWLLSCIIAALLVSRCSRNMVSSLEQINSDINSIAAGDLDTDSQPSAQSNREFASITASINHMRDSLLQNQVDNEHYMEQSTEDLRETLDTIEVQNIELNIERKKALEASRIKSEFLANTSHEFRTPLNGIIGFTQLALRTELSDQQHTYLRTILDSSQNLLTSINDILDFSKLETGQLSLDYHPVNPRSCIEDTLKILAPIAQEKKLELITLLDTELSEHLLGDPLRLKQILSNLIGNAIKFSENGNIIVRAQTVASHDTHEEIKISITDSGIGLSQEQQQELFNPFAQADTSNAREYGGTGLGLSICKGLIERMAGEIGVDSKLGQGSTFWIKIKLGIDRNHAASPTPIALASHERTLIFSQNSMATLQLQDLLETWKFTSEVQSNIEHLLSDIKNANSTGKPYDLLIIDSNFNLNHDDYQNLKKVIWQASQRYRCRIVIIACSEQYSLMVDDTLQKLTRCCLKPLITHELQEQLTAKAHSDTKDSVITAPLTTTPAQQQHTPANQGAEAPRILVVDDNPANLQLASELLKGIGAKVYRANNGSEALQQCDEEDFDLIFMDVQMPVLDGMETTKELRMRQGAEKRTPVVALTAHAMSDQKTKLLLAGMDDYLHKPVSESQLRHAINRWSPNTATTDTISSPPPKNQHDTSNDEVSANNSLVVDRSLCLKLANQKSDLARDMLTMLIDAAKDDLQQLPKLYQGQDFQALSERVHKLYGSSCYSGVPALKNISGALDKILQQESYDNAEIEQRLDELYSAINNLLEWSEEFDIDVLFECD